ncbi:MAG: FixH family protein [Saprospiraceae bacterium]|nr:FixH family protein [Saprospiraceae bacterium]
MNWGYGITIVYGVFVVAMLGAVIASTQHDPGLVSKDYYNLDLNYQAHFDKKQNAADMAVPLAVRYEAGSGDIVIVFPSDMSVARGSIQFRRTSTTKDDYLYTLPAIPAGQELRIPAAGMAEGRWLMDVDWTSTGKDYFFATSVAVFPT